ncbi:hypothetical protein ACVIGB_008508 [Bradyrhizobium sp. USDA 4341]
MARYFYRHRMGIYAETLFRRSQRERHERDWLRYNLIRLGKELRHSEHWSSAANQPVRQEATVPEPV